MLSRKLKSAGFTFLEFLGVMALVGAGYLIVARQMDAAGTHSQATALTNGVGQVIEKVPPLYVPTFAAITCADMVNNGAFKNSGFRVDGTNVFYGGDAATQLTCAPATLFATNDGYTLTFPAMTDELCASFANKVAQHAWSITVNGVLVKVLGAAINPDATGTQCTTTGGSHPVAVNLMRQRPAQ